MDNLIFEHILEQMKKYSVQVQTDRLFSQMTTLGCGGRIKLTVFPDTVRKLIKVVRLLDKLGVERYVLGRGSNVLASDDDYDGVVISTTKMSKICVHGVKICALAGVSTIQLYKQTERLGLSGGEFLSCLPASVGGATVCHAGCYGQDIKGILHSVTVLYNGRLRRLSAKQCNLTRRSSLFKQDGGYTVLSVTFKLTRSTTEQVRELSEHMRATKSATQPLNCRSAGCVLYHDQVSISRLTDMAGLKGYTVGGAQVSDKHAGFVLNVDKASAKDIYLVIRHIQRTIWERFGVVAKREVCLVNFNSHNE